MRVRSTAVAEEHKQEGDFDWETLSNPEEKAEMDGQKEKTSGKADSPWPKGWIQADIKVARKMCPENVTHKCIEKVAELTTRMLGGSVKKITEDVKDAPYHETTIETELCSTVHIGITRRPSRSAYYRDMGSRIYFTGVAKNQRQSATVQEWLRELSRVAV